MSITKSVDKKTGKIKWIARIYIKEGPGGMVNKSFDTQKEAREFHTNYDNFKKGRIDRKVSSNVLFPIVFENYILDIESTKKDNTVKNYRQTFEKWIRPELGTIKIGNITQVTINRLMDALRKKDASEYVVNYVHILLNNIFNFATNATQRYVIDNPMIGLKKPTLDYNPTDTIKFWTKEDAEKVLKTSIGSHYYLLITIMINTGLRVAEAAALTASSFDMTKGVLNINHQLTNYSPKDGEEKFNNGHLVINSTKGKAKRSVPLNKNATEAAKLLIAKNKESGNYFLFTPEQKTKPRNVITKRGHKAHVIGAQVLSTKTMGNAIARLAEAAGVENIGPHGLRHTFAANFLMNGGDIFTLSRILGHKNITSTQIYAHLTEQFLASRMNIVEFGG